MTTASLPPGGNDFLPFPDDSATRFVHREGVLLLGGGRALLMQIAHPMVAKGVATHSSFRSGRIDRLLRTLRPTLAVVFGTQQQALEAVASINRVHERVIGPDYAATDPDLLLWVLATLIDSSLVTYERFVGPLSNDAKAAYYEDTSNVGALLGIPLATMPETIEALQAYVERMCDELTVTDDAREITSALFRSNPLTWPFYGPLRWLTAGLLPERLRAQFGLGWGPKRATALDALCAASRFVVPKLPHRLRAPPWFVLPRSSADA